MRNLNIKSDEAYELATDLAKKTGKTLTLVVTEALQEQARILNRDAKIKRALEIAASAAPMWEEPWKSKDHGDLLYDENGLPI